MSATHQSTQATQVIIYALLANLGIALAKLAGALFTKSASMLAEAVHSFVDSFNQVLLLVGAKKSLKPPTKTHPLGFGREAFFWSFIVAILLFSLGGLFAIYEGVHKLSGHSEVQYPEVAFIILVVSLALEGFSLWACIKEVKKHTPLRNVLKWTQKTTSSELLVVLIEDTAALIGLLIALFCLTTSWITGNPIWDAVGSIAVGCVLVIVAIFLAIEIKSLIIGEAPNQNYSPEIEALIQNQLPKAKLLRIIALQTGANEVLLSMKIHPGPEESVSRLIAQINLLEKKIKTRFPEIRWLFVEPDFED